MTTMKLEKEGDVHILRLQNPETGNAFTLDVIDEYHKAMDEIENSEGNTSLIITSDDPKSWCNGINLDWLNQKDDAFWEKFLGHLEDMVFRLATLPVPTMGCITGHVFAGGAIMAAGLDFRTMRSDRGWFCFPEVDIKIPFGNRLTYIIDLYPNRAALWELALSGRRVGGEEAKRRELVNDAFPQEELWEKSFAMAKMLAAKDRKTYADIKKRLKRNLINEWKLPRSYTYSLES